MDGRGPDDAFWIDGEWLPWDSIVDPEEVACSRLAELEREAALRHRYPDADPTLIPYFRDLLTLARSYFEETGRHLAVYGDIGELFGAIMYGIVLHRNNAIGSDGRLGNDFVEIKTISPASRTQRTNVRFDRHFSHLLVVRIDAAFDVSAKLLDRASVARASRRSGTVAWRDIA